jgi:hypothetical protein
MLLTSCGARIFVLDGGSSTHKALARVEVLLLLAPSFEQLFKSTVVQSDLLSCCGSHCIKYRSSSPFLDI